MTMELAERLKDARQRTGQPLQAVAEAARLSTAYLHKLEAGKVNSPNPRVLMRLADVLDLSYPELMRASDYLMPTEDRPASAGAKPSSSGQVAPPPKVRVSAGNPDIVRLLEDVLGRLDVLTRQHEDLQRLVAARPG